MSYTFLHTCIRVLDIEASIRFYEDALNFKVTEIKDFPDDFKLVYMSDNQGLFELELTYNYGRTEPYDLGNGYSHLAVLTSDLDASYKRHQEAGYKITNIGGLKKGSSRFYFITDPDGYDIEIIQR